MRGATLLRNTNRPARPVFEPLEGRIFLDADDLFTPAIVFDPYGVGSASGDWTIDDPYFYMTPQASGTAYFIHGGGDGDATIKLYKRSGGGWSLVATESNKPALTDWRGWRPTSPTGRNTRSGWTCTRTGRASTARPISRSGPACRRRRRSPSPGRRRATAR